MSEGYDIKECAIHGAYVADACPRCDEIKADNYTRCRTHNISTHVDDAIGCPECEREGLIAQQSPQKVAKRLVSKSPSVVMPNVEETGGMLTYSGYKKLSPNKVSKEEYTRYCYLYNLASKGIISNLSLQERYVLSPAFDVPAVNWYTSSTKKGGYRSQERSYSPDFRYTYNGVSVVEEYKGVLTSKLKPRKDTTASLKMALWLSAHSSEIASGKLFFYVVGWHNTHGRYYAFDTNSNLIEYDLTNYYYELEKTG